MKFPKPTNPKNKYTYHVKEMMFVSNFKKHMLKFCLCTAVFLFAILITLLPYIITKRIQHNHKIMRYPSDLKYILFWKQPKHKSVFRKGFNEFTSGQRPFIDQKCRHINCYITYNKSFLGNDVNNFDAIVFDVHDISKLKNFDVNFTKSPEQKYIFRAHESSEKQPICNPMFEGFFSWTWTYKLDSEIPHPFLNIYDINNKLVGPKKNMDWLQNMNHSESTKGKIQRKKKGVAWIVTRCKLKSKHVDFVKLLRKELKGYNYSVDVYGPCSEKKCNGSQVSCFKMVERDYYFQMVLEDSFTEDFVSENIVKALSYFSIPIVYGGADYTRFLPPGTYINAKAFDIKKLGALIDYLIKNPLMYEYFFDWKNHYFYTVKHRSQVCDLCAKLNSQSMDIQKTKSDFRMWWNPRYEDICQRMHLIKLFDS